MTLPTSDPTPAPLPSHKRSFTTTQGTCTAVCWDLLPGTGCDVQCRESGITKMPPPTSGVSSLWKTTFTTEGCGVTCQDLMPGTECGLSCSGTFPTQAPGKVIHPSLVHCHKLHFFPMILFSYSPLRNTNMHADSCALQWQLLPTVWLLKLVEMLKVCNLTFSNSQISMVSQNLVREAHDARLARKFGLGARDDGEPIF